MPFDEDPYGRSARYRELPPHRMPQYEDEVIGKVKKNKLFLIMEDVLLLHIISETNSSSP